MVLPPGVEWSRLATRPGDPTPGRRTLLSSGSRWDAIQVDLVHVTGPFETPETSLPTHRLAAHLDGPSETRVWFDGVTKFGECVPGDICIFPATMPFTIGKPSPAPCRFAPPPCQKRLNSRGTSSGGTP